LTRRRRRRTRRRRRRRRTRMLGARRELGHVTQCGGGTGSCVWE
jgi:hypothetical protein